MMRRRFSTNVLAAVAAVLFSGQAFAYCIEPLSPGSYGTRPVRPAKPSCIEDRFGNDKCSDGDLSRYNRQLRAYRNDLEDYKRGLETYADIARDYAQCEMDDE